MNKKLFAASVACVERFSSTRCGTLISVASEYDYAYVVMKHTQWRWKHIMTGPARQWVRDYV